MVIRLFDDSHSVRLWLRDASSSLFKQKKSWEKKGCVQSQMFFLSFCIPTTPSLLLYTHTHVFVTTYLILVKVQVVVVDGRGEKRERERDGESGKKKVKGRSNIRGEIMLRQHIIIHSTLTHTFLLSLPLYWADLTEGKKEGRGKFTRLAFFFFFYCLTVGRRPSRWIVMVGIAII